MPVAVRLHPHRAEFLARTRRLGRAWDHPGAWELFRFVDPRFTSAAQIASGEGARHAAGRWHPPGGTMLLSYTALRHETALAETLAHSRYFALPVSTALPRVLVSLNLSAGRVLDPREGPLRRRLRLSLKTICHCDWRRDNQRGEEAGTQAWGVVFEAAGFEAVIVPSGAERGGVNALVFPANLQPGSLCRVTRQVQRA